MSNQANIDLIIGIINKNPQILPDLKKQVKEFGDAAENSGKKAEALGNLGGKFQEIGQLLGPAGEQLGSFGSKLSEIAAAAGPLGAVAAGVLALAGAIGVATVAAFEAAKNVADFAEKVSNAAVASGAAEDSIIGLGTAMEEAGKGGIETAGKALSKLNILLAQAAKGNEEAQKTLEDLGTSYKDAATGGIKSVDDALVDISNSAKESGGALTKNASLIKAFGEEGLQAIKPVLASFTEYKKSSSDLISQKVLENAKAFDGALDALTTKLRSISLAAGGEVAPAFTEFINTLSEGIEKFANNESAVNGLRGLLQIIEAIVTGPGAKLLTLLLSLGETVASFTGFIAAAAGVTDELGDAIKNLPPSTEALSNAVEKLNGKYLSAAEVIQLVEQRLVKLRKEQELQAQERANENARAIAAIEDQEKQGIITAEAAAKKITEIKLRESQTRLSQAQSDLETEQSLVTNAIKVQQQRITEALAVQKQAIETQKKNEADLEVFKEQIFQAEIARERELREQNPSQLALEGIRQQVKEESALQQLQNTGYQNALRNIKTATDAQNTALAKVNEAQHTINELQQKGIQKNLELRIAANKAEGELDQAKRESIKRQQDGILVDLAKSLKDQEKLESDQTAKLQEKLNERVVNQQEFEDQKLQITIDTLKAQNAETQIALNKLSDLEGSSVEKRKELDKQLSLNRSRIRALEYDQTVKDVAKERGLREAAAAQNEALRNTDLIRIEEFYQHKKDLGEFDKTQEIKQQLEILDVKKRAAQEAIDNKQKEYDEAVKLGAKEADLNKILAERRGLENEKREIANQATKAQKEQNQSVEQGSDFYTEQTARIEELGAAYHSAAGNAAAFNEVVNNVAKDLAVAYDPARDTIEAGKQELIQFKTFYEQVLKDIRTTGVSAIRELQIELTESAIEELTKKIAQAEAAAAAEARRIRVAEFKEANEEIIEEAEQFQDDLIELEEESAERQREIRRDIRELIRDNNQDIIDDAEEQKEELKEIDDEFFENRKKREEEESRARIERARQEAKAIKDAIADEQKEALSEEEDFITERKKLRDKVKELEAAAEKDPNKKGDLQKAQDELAALEKKETQRKEREARRQELLEQARRESKSQAEFEKRAAAINDQLDQEERFLDKLAELGADADAEDIAALEALNKEKQRLIQEQLQRELAELAAQEADKAAARQRELDAEKAAYEERRQGQIDAFNQAQKDRDQQFKDRLKQLQDALAAEKKRFDDAKKELEDQFSKTLAGVASQLNFGRDALAGFFDEALKGIGKTIPGFDAILAKINAIADKTQQTSDAAADAANNQAGATSPTGATTGTSTSTGGNTTTSTSGNAGAGGGSGSDIFGGGSSAVAKGGTSNVSGSSPTPTGPTAKDTNPSNATAAKTTTAGSNAGNGFTGSKDTVGSGIRGQLIDQHKAYRKAGSEPDRLAVTQTAQTIMLEYLRDTGKVNEKFQTADQLAGKPSKLYPALQEVLLALPDKLQKYERKVDQFLSLADSAEKVNDSKDDTTSPESDATADTGATVGRTPGEEQGKRGGLVQPAGPNGKRIDRTFGGSGDGSVSPTPTPTPTPGPSPTSTGGSPAPTPTASGGGGAGISVPITLNVLLQASANIPQAERDKLRQLIEALLRQLIASGAFTKLLQGQLAQLESDQDILELGAEAFI